MVYEAIGRPKVPTSLMLRTLILLDIRLKSLQSQFLQI